jgi:hypothetical protein
MELPEKIELVLTYRHDPKSTEIFTERVAAEKVGEYYKIIHVPAFAPNIAYGDIVKVEFDDGEFHFDQLIEESGYSVAHIIVWKIESKDLIVSALNNLGCGVNTHLAENYIVVSVPPELLYEPIRHMLEKEWISKNIDFRDCLSKIHSGAI